MADVSRMLRGIMNAKNISRNQNRVERRRLRQDKVQCPDATRDCKGYGVRKVRLEVGLVKGYATSARTRSSLALGDGCVMF